MDKKKLLSVFLKNFFIAGIVIGLYSLLMEIFSPEFVGFVHGALPITFTYLVFLTYIKYKGRLNNMVYISGLSGFLWIGFVLLIYIFLRNGLSLPLSYVITSIIFILCCYCFWNKFKDKFSLNR